MEQKTPSMAKYVPPHARRQRSQRNCAQRECATANTATTRAIFFGDSFVRLFGLVEHPAVTIEAFKGASAKGLTRDGNDNRLKILRVVETRAHRTDRWVFCFGSVDVHMSYYHKKFQRNKGANDLAKIARSYVDFVASSLPVGNHSRATIVGIYPSPLDDEDVPGSLVNYGSIEESTMERVRLSEDSLLANRQARARSFNQALKSQCRKHHRLEYFDVFDDVIEKETQAMKPLYRDVSDHNVHVVWETTILLWLRKWPWLERLASPTLHQRLERSLREYLGTKAWAERRHPSQLEKC